MCKLSLHNLHKAKFIPTKFRLATLIILSPLCARPRPFCHFERSREISKRSDGQNGRLLIFRSCRFLRFVRRLCLLPSVEMTHGKIYLNRHLHRRCKLHCALYAQLHTLPKAMYFTLRSRRKTSLIPICRAIKKRSGAPFFCYMLQ